jgi:ubiquinone/menaquinone biosynthesis C-methylase UbiE
MNSVEKTYNKIAKDFDRTRYKVWNKVAQFLDSLKPSTKVLEVGCGNGKNMLYRTDLHLYGIDISDEQVVICKEKGLDVEKSNMTKLLFSDSEFDSIICIATYHHLDNNKERAQALKEMYRVLKKSGIVMICVWAMEQPSNTKHRFTKSDELVSWKMDNEIHYRYYHIYKKGELEEEIRLLCPEFTTESVFYDCGNWYILLSKF